MANQLEFHHMDSDEAREERRRVACGELPDRYAEEWAQPFLSAVSPCVDVDSRVLDVGSGRRPVLTADRRPPSCEYVGLDISGAELAAAPDGSYTETIVADATTYFPELDARFDLVMSWQVLEHVRSLSAALENFHRYLRPGGLTVHLLSGRYSAFAMIGRIVPYRISVAAMTRLMDVEAESKFPTHYDDCYYAALARILSTYSDWKVIPRYKGGTYFRFARPIERAYLAYENAVCRRNWRNLATHYIVIARR